MVREAARQIGKPLRKCRVALIGLSDRAYTCEGVVSSPTIDLALRLRKIGAFVKVFDPYRLGSELDKVGIKVSRRLEECLGDTDIIIILPESKVMKTIMVKKLGVAKALAQTSLAIIDLAGVIDRVEASRLGFIYVGLDGALHAG
jgi:UDP-N-acetyl-D-mannosaminuronate dehydrogenase